MTDSPARADRDGAGADARESGGGDAGAGAGASAHPSICPALRYEDAHAALRQLTGAFGFTEVAVYEDEETGTVVHAELSYGNGVVMLGSTAEKGALTDAPADGGPAGVYVRVSDVDAHHRRAVAHGAEILTAPADEPYGARTYTARDTGGHVWSFGDYAPSTMPPG
ncbi:VOC family protein [Streptomyces sp. S07_1.15]|uniref:VOC family protein n=1 Tax=Streptomyces sp. S07_1.15 TaxID=2873925 RepID=UPI001D151CCB|nr:VOC family protein [Streptomyces sp. S07_1.15]MCC3654836.1 VOC family protein [Streptomyces sp. S07_1.15]